jgi:polyphosphate kinase 2
MKRAHTPAKAARADYKEQLYGLQVQLVRLQRHVIREGLKVVVLFEGRDAAGKDGVIKRIAQHLSPRETRVVALSKPSDRDRSTWYFQRFVAQLPVGGEIVLFNRSWYNRAGVERVMGFCSPAEYETFMEDSPLFEQLLVRSDTLLRKYYLDITRPEQRRRLARRAHNPLTQWKISPIDGAALDHWDDYSRARNQMLARTHTTSVPWSIVRADDKYAARLNVIRDLLSSLDYKGKDERLLRVNARVLFDYSEKNLASLAP